MPSLSYFNGQLFAAWQTHSDQGAAVAVATFANTPARTLALVDTIAAPELPASPSLSAGGDALRLLWVRQPLENQPTDLYAMRYNGSHFVAELPGEASPGGFSRSGGIATQLVAATDATGRTSVAWLDAISGQPEIHARGMSATVSRTFYANSVTGIQAILDGNDLAAGDFIVVNGSVNGDVTIAAGDAGVAIVGAPGSRIVGSVTVAAGANNVLLQGLDISGTVTVQGANGFTLTESKAGAVTLQGGANAQITANQLSGNLTLQGAVNAALIDSNRINAATGLDLQAGAAVSNLTVSRNNFQGTNGIALNAAASGRIRDNSISASATGLNIAAAFSGLIDGNRIANAGVGVRYDAAAALAGNTISNNTVGIRTTVAGNSTGLGFVAGSGVNDLVGNATGIQAVAAQFQQQHVRGGNVGVTGSGIIGGTSLDLANLIEGAATGIANFTGIVQYSRISGNGVGIDVTSAMSGLKVWHNLIYRNTTAALRITGANDIRIYQNTFYAPSGDNIRIQAPAPTSRFRATSCGRKPDTTFTSPTTRNPASTATTTICTKPAAANWFIGPKTSPTYWIGRPTWPATICIRSAPPWSIRNGRNRVSSTGRPTITACTTWWPACASPARTSTPPTSCSTRRYRRIT